VGEPARAKLLLLLRVREGERGGAAGEGEERGGAQTLRDPAWGRGEPREQRVYHFSKELHGIGSVDETWLLVYNS
jgi:hypothetical protein